MSRRFSFNDRMTNPVTIWNGVQYAASQKELERLESEFGLDKRMLQPALVPKRSKNLEPVSARNSVMLQQRRRKSAPSQFGVTGSTSTGTSANSGWILRYNNTTVTNFHPWRQQGDNKFGQFDLVPWRRQRSAHDLATVTDTQQSSPFNAKSLNRLEKLELRKNRRHLKTQNKCLRRFVRVRLIFSIELRHKRLEILRQCQLPPRVFEQKFSVSEVENAEYERILLDANASVDDHLGYFSKRCGSSDMQLKPKLCNLEQRQYQQLLDHAVARSDNEIFSHLIVVDGGDSDINVKNTKNMKKVSSDNISSSVLISSSSSGFGAVAASSLLSSGQTSGSEQKKKTVPCDKCRHIAIKLG